MFVLGIAEWVDKGLLHDIDLKCFDDVWSSEYWLYWLLDDTKTVFLVRDGHDGLPVGMAVCVFNKDGIVIEKLGVKGPYRRQGVSRMLLDAVRSMQVKYESDVPIYLAIPETWMYDGYSGHPNGLTDWVSRVGLKAERKLLPGYFWVGGESLDGIRFVLEPRDQMGDQMGYQMARKKRVPLCWQCHTRVQYGDDGWYCSECGQGGKPDNIKDDWETGRLRRTPYMGEE